MHLPASNLERNPGISPSDLAGAPGVPALDSEMGSVADSRVDFDVKEERDA